MKAASINEIKKELQNLDHEILLEACLRLARFKKENKEMLTYLLFEAQHEHIYVEEVKAEMENLFAAISAGSNVYFIKKSLRKILRFLNRQVRYSESKTTELELRIFFCVKMKEARLPMTTGTVLYNIYQQQLKKVISLYEKLPDDLQADYERELSGIR